MTTPIGMDGKSQVKGVELRLDTLIQGLLSSLPAGVTSLVVGGVQYSVADFVAKVKGVNAPFKTARAANSTIRQVRMTREQDRKVALDLLGEAKAALSAILSSKSIELTKFGFKPKGESKPRISPAEKLLRAAEAKLTRAKRHTMGSRQKADVRQTEAPTVTVTPDGSVNVMTTPAATPAAPSSNAGTARPAV